MLALVLTVLLGSLDEGAVLPAAAPFTGEPVSVCTSATGEVVNGSRAQFDPLGRGVWVLDDENDELLLVPLEATSRAPATFTPQLARFRVGRWPEQLVVSPEGRVFVTARQTGQVFVVEPDLQTWVIPLSPEPRSLSLDVTRQRLYVGLVTANEVVALDARSGAVLARRATLEPPDFLALTPGLLAVGSRRSDVLTWWGPGLEVKGAGVLEVDADLALAAPSSSLSVMLAFGLTLSVGEAPTRTLAALTAEGTRLVAVVESASTRPPRSGLSLNDLGLGLGRFGRGAGAGYGGSSSPVSHELLVGLADTRGMGWVRSASFGAVVPREVLLSNGKAWVVSESRRSIDCFDADLRLQTLLQPRSGSLREASAVALSGGDPSWVLVTRDRRLYHLRSQPQPDASPLERERVLRMGDDVELSVTTLPPSQLDDQLRRGRQLFHLASGQLSRFGIACVTCHPDGREDGRVWTQAGTLRQTPLLTGRLADTAPYNWLGSSRTLDDNLHQTITERLEGSGLSEADTVALRRYLLEGLRPVTTRAPASDALVAFGAEVFADEEVGCAHCHRADRGFTDGKRHDVKSVSAAERSDFVRRVGRAPLPKKFDTPSLRNLKVSAPYFHNGQARTLGELLEHNHDRMGVTSQLSTGERAALVAYLESL